MGHLPLHRLDENRPRGLSRLPQIRSEDSQTKIKRLTHRFVINPASWARSRSLAWIALPQQALRVLAVQLCYRNELVEDPALFPNGRSTRIGPLWLPQVRPVSSCSPASYPPMPLTPKRSNSDEAQVYIQQHFRRGNARSFFKFRQAANETGPGKHGTRSGSDPRVPPASHRLSMAFADHGPGYRFKCLLLKPVPIPELLQSAKWVFDVRGTRRVALQALSETPNRAT